MAAKNPITLNVADLSLFQTGDFVDIVHGGTGTSSPLTGYLKGNGLAAFSASSTIPNSDVSGLGTLSTQNSNSAALDGPATISLSSSSAGLTITQSGSGLALSVSGTYASNIVAVSALDVDCSKGNYFTKTISADSTFTFSNVPASRAYSFTLEVTHSSGAITWPPTVKWPADTAPTLTTAKTHLFMFVTDDGGARWRGAYLADYTN